jgi:hypothetical protein
MITQISGSVSGLIGVVIGQYPTEQCASSSSPSGGMHVWFFTQALVQLQCNFSVLYFFLFGIIFA